MTARKSHTNALRDDIITFGGLDLVVFRLASVACTCSRLLRCLSIPSLCVFGDVMGDSIEKDCR